MSDSPLRVVSGGTPSDEEMAAITAAASVLLFAPTFQATEAQVPRWRFSGRWWSKPIPLRRRRP